MMTLRSSKNINYEGLLSLVPVAPNWAIDWATIWALWDELGVLDSCPQDPIHHAEGDVGIHTRMVVEALVSDPQWQSLPEQDRSTLFWAAVLHDIGKPAVTKHEDNGRISSKGHSRVGASIARRLLWETGAPFEWREALCGLIVAHQMPFWLIERPWPERLAIETSWKCRPDLLSLHARADVMGRICEDQSDILDNIALSHSIFEEVGCLDEAFAFANDESRVAFFERDDRDAHYAAHEDFRCTVTVMSGLPGSGKDTWIAAHRSEHPVVSLDAIREELGTPATGNQGRVIQAAYERAREHLRNQRDFVWNATNITAQLRSKPLRLLRNYNARIEIAYIEVPPNKLFAQNKSRNDAVPATVLQNLTNKLEPPGEWEAHRVLKFIDGEAL